ncbi:GNAT family N-acetyltransferase [Flagellimonas hymeniacidonis]|uniref:GNAT family N-acetyltransferase n=1 Tax=Flagellimonas hymeniacidonis TaxID=2603628 RepID=A0A5C8V4J9_9FLAO|nr:GNAT family N-acetyltransferase [Flagellimonas hymeniacidonis]TXN36805.1 GNAT family N-acetyltransferase [Flagellimonas hymeniacidonis]
MTASDFTIRNATLEDLPILLNFEQELILAERPFDVTLKEDPISYYDIKQMILDEHASVVVAEMEGQVIASGYAIPKKARHYLNHEYYAYLGFMYTHPDFRGRGVNAKIVEVLKKWSTEQGFKEMRLTVYSDNIPALKAYEKVGFKKHIVEMRLE